MQEHAGTPPMSLQVENGPHGDGTHGSTTIGLNGGANLEIMFINTGN